MRPKLPKKIAEESAAEYPLGFFMLALDKDYPELEKLAAKNLAKSETSWFFSFKLHKKYPRLILSIEE